MPTIDPRIDAYIESAADFAHLSHITYHLSLISEVIEKEKVKMLGVNPYISFKGNAKEAIEFYKEALNAEVLFSQPYGESPMAEMGPADAIMHATLKIGDSHVMMCDDCRPEVADTTPSNISLAIGLNDTEQAKLFFDNLSQGGTVTMPLDKTFWAEAFGMLTDKFGINWMVNCDQPQETDKSATA